MLYEEDRSGQLIVARNPKLQVEEFCLRCHRYQWKLATQLTSGLLTNLLRENALLATSTLYTGASLFFLPIRERH